MGHDNNSNYGGVRNMKVHFYYISLKGTENKYQITVKTRLSTIENQWLHRPKIKNYITDSAKKS